MIEDSAFPSNAHKKDIKKEKPKVEKVISGDAVKRRRSLLRKIADTFTGDDAQSVGNYILFDVIIPAAKAMISDATSQGVERILFGDARERRRSQSRNYTSYNSYSAPSRSSHPAGRAGEPDERRISRKARAAHEFDEIILQTRGEAEEVLDRLTDLINDYDIATVADLFDLVGITGSFTDNKWGWTNLRNASVTRVREGYLLDLPRTEALD